MNDLRKLVLAGILSIGFLVYFIINSHADTLRMVTKITEPQASSFRSAFLLQYPVPSTWSGTTDEWINKSFNDMCKPILESIANYPVELNYKRKKKEAEDEKSKSITIIEVTN